jgi:hypothetical protein
MGLLAKINTLKSRGGRKAEGLLVKSLESLQRIDSKEILVPTESEELQLESEEPKGLLKASQLFARIAEERRESLPADQKISPTAELTELQEEEDTVTQIGKLSRGFDSVPHFFRILHDWLEFRKGSLLVTVNNSNELIPCALTGFNSASIKSLRIAPEEVPPLLTNACSEFSKGSLEKARNLFSDQDFDDLEALFLSPVSSGGKTISLLIVSGISEDRFKEAENVLGGEYPKIIQARYSVLKSIADRRYRAETDLSQDLDLIRESIKNGLVPSLYKVSYEPVIERLTSDNTFINAEWLEKDLLQILGYLLSNLGNLYLLGDRSVLLVVQHASDIDNRLMAHQTAMALRKYYSETRSPLLVRIEYQTVEDISEYSAV